MSKQLKKQSAELVLPKTFNSFIILALVFFSIWFYFLPNSGFSKSKKNKSPKSASINILYESEFDVFVNSKNVGSYKEKLTSMSKTLSLEYTLDLKGEMGGKKEVFVGVSKNNRHLTPISWSLTYETTDAKGNTLESENWIQGEKTNQGKMKIVTRTGTKEWHVERPRQGKIQKGMILQSFLPLYLLKSKDGLVPNSKKNFLAIDEEGTIGKFEPVPGYAKIGAAEKISGKLANQVDVSWGKIDAKFWILPDGSLIKMHNPSLGLELRRRFKPTIGLEEIKKDNPGEKSKRN